MTRPRGTLEVRDPRRNAAPAPPEERARTARHLSPLAGERDLMTSTLAPVGAAPRPASHPLTGPELAAARVGTGIYAREVAVQLGLTRARVSAIEHTAALPARTSVRYLEGLAAAVAARAER